MKLITTDEQLHRLIPNVFANVEGESSLLEKLTPFLETSEDWAKQHFVPDDLLELIAESASEPTAEAARPLDACTARNSTLSALHSTLTKIVAYHAFLSAIPSLDLVLTPNGFGIVSNQNVAPASKERVERLQASLEQERDRNIEQLLLRLPTVEGWEQSAQGKYFAATIFPFLSLCRRLAIREHLWDEYQHLHDRLIKIENVLAETYFSQEQMQVFRNKVMDQMRTCHPLEEQVIRSLQSLELMLVSDMQVHNQSFYDLVNIIREHSDIFLAWHSSETAKLYSPAVFRNKKKSGGYWF
jgi:hypothetical protein